MKALGLVNLISYSIISISGIKGKENVEIEIRIGKSFKFFVFLKYHFIFELFVDGNSVREVE